MKVSLGWLATFVDLPSQAELEERLTLAGLEIEEVLRTGPDLSAIRVGHVLERAPAPERGSALASAASTWATARPPPSCVARRTSQPVSAWRSRFPA